MGSLPNRFASTQRYYVLGCTIPDDAPLKGVLYPKGTSSKAFLPKGLTSTAVYTPPKVFYPSKEHLPRPSYIQGHTIGALYPKDTPSTVIFPTISPEPHAQELS